MDLDSVIGDDELRIGIDPDTGFFVLEMNMPVSVVKISPIQTETYEFLKLSGTAMSPINPAEAMNWVEVARFRYFTELIENVHRRQSK